MRVLILVWAFMVWALGAAAQEPGALARFLPEESAVELRRGTLELTLGLSQPVPYRVYTLASPARLVIDFRSVDWGGAGPEAVRGAQDVAGLRFGQVARGWSRFVLDLGGPLALKAAALERGGAGVTLKLALERVTPEVFLARSGAPKGRDWPEPKPVQAPERDGGIVVMLDPGHGGIDPGATRGGLHEKDLMLSFAREIAEALRRVEGVRVILTREEDAFVSLERRVALAHQAGADLFLSLHADALGEGHARGATVYTLADEASDRATALLVERHNRVDLLAGVDLSGQDDEVADVLLDLARQETQPRSERLARAIVLGLEAKGAPLNRRPYRAAGFSVLKAADIPSVLLEIGFLSSTRDFENISDPAWRREMAQGLSEGIQAWMLADEAIRKVVRK